LLHEQWGNDSQSTTTAGELTAVFIDVGQGDATLIKAPSGETLLIDAGPWDASDAVVTTLDNEGISELTAIIATHYHADHIGGIPAVIESIQTEVIYDRGHSYGEYSPAYEHYVEAAGARRTALHPCDRVHVGEVVLQTVAANGEVCGGGSVALDGDENAASLAFVMEYAGFRMFIGGDLTGGGGNFPYITPDVESLVADVVGNVDVLKVNHHGSHTSSNQSFLDALMPEHAIISCGDDNDHHHPHAAVVDRLIESGATVYQTQQCWTEDERVNIADGNITMRFDGETISF
jgi:beta-lactamase superfamily II metal-dependent hydrolase